MGCSSDEMAAGSVGFEAGRLRNVAQTEIKSAAAKSPGRLRCRRNLHGLGPGCPIQIAREEQR